MEHLRDFANTTIETDCTELSGVHDNELFFGCQFDKLAGLTLRNCDLNRSEFVTDSIKDALGFTLSLDCLSFRGVKYSPMLFDLYLMMAYMTTGNDEKREKLLDVVGRDRAEAYLRVLRRLE